MPLVSRWVHSPYNVHPEMVVSAELHKEPHSPQVVCLIIVHSTLVKNVLLTRDGVHV